MRQLKLMFITNSVERAREAVRAGVDRIFVDLETIGKAERQGHLDTTRSYHRIDDIAAIRRNLPEAEIIVRVNPIYQDSKYEIDRAIDLGADILMLPMFTTTEEVRQFIGLVNGRAMVNLLLETPQALVRLPDYLRYAEHIDEIHVGLNDLHLGMRLSFMFELLAGGIVDHVSSLVREAGVRFGFGGIAAIGFGDIPAEQILVDHVRLGSEVVFLSRSFWRAASNTGDQQSLADRVQELRNYFARLQELSDAELELRSKELRQRIFSHAQAKKAVV